MKIELKRIPIRDVFSGYVNSDEEGVVGYFGKLNIRPKYQREFIYKDEQRDNVLKSVQRDLPLNVMYWVKNDDLYEVLDGQQRTISICSYINGDFSIDYKYFHTLTKEEQEQILDYELMIYVCEGTDKEKLEWFQIINIAGERLTNQELRNAIYTGPWLIDAKRYFSKTNCPAYNIGKDYLSGSSIRQEYLETVLKWISAKENLDIKDYMAAKQHEEDAEELWIYFQSVMDWVKRVFPNYRREMKGIAWGTYYNKFKDKEFKPREIESKIQELSIDEDVTSKKGIYEYMIDGNEKHLSLRSFSEKTKRESFERQKGICVKCQEVFTIEEMEADHITPWSEGGRTTPDNCQMLCKLCNRSKSNK